MKIYHELLIMNVGIPSVNNFVYMHKHEDSICMSDKSEDGMVTSAGHQAKTFEGLSQSLKPSPNSLLEGIQSFV